MLSALHACMPQRGMHTDAATPAPTLIPPPPFACTAPTMDIVEMVLGGRVNKSLVQLIQQAGGQAVGLSGKDGNMLKARQMVELDIGFVGEVTKVDPTVLETMSRNGFIPVVATIATDDKGQALNINADTAAGEVNLFKIPDRTPAAANALDGAAEAVWVPLPTHLCSSPVAPCVPCPLFVPQIAAALQAEKLVLMTDVPGVLHNKDDPKSLYRALNIRQCRTLIEEGVIAGGMIPKVCIPKGEGCRATKGYQGGGRGWGCAAEEALLHAQHMLIGLALSCPAD